MNKKLGYELYGCLREYYKYYLPFDVTPEHDPNKLADEVFVCFKLGEEEKE